MDNSKKKEIGRPTKYKPEYCQSLIDFFDVEPYTDKELEHYGKDGEVKWVDYKRMANKMPTLRNFSKEIGVGISTVYDWLNKNHASYHKEFSDSFTQAKDLQKWFLIENGLNGCYNPLFAKFVAVNITDMIDKTDLTSGGKPLNLSYDPTFATAQQAETDNIEPSKVQDS